MTKSITLELEIEPDFEEQIVYEMVCGLFDVEIEFEGTQFSVFGCDRSVTAWLAFYILPLIMGEA
tara:strand:- start:1161 stop:1355 length:195 start_codon:yes stop_codon:yes gene_type:complete